MLKICLSGNGYGEHHFSQLATKGFEVIHKPEHLSERELQISLPDYDAYILGGDERLTEPVLKHASKLRVISFVGTGSSSFIDEVSAKKYNIAVKNTPAVMAPAVAEHTIGLLLGVQRKLFQYNSQIKNHSIQSCITDELSSLCIGIIGMGEIGSRISKILRQAFGSKVIYYSRTRKTPLETDLNLTYVSLENIFSTADVIIFAIPTNAETEYFVNDNLLAKAKPGVIIINTAGARLIDPHALKKYIDNNIIAAAALDGYYIEPLPTVAEDPFHLLSLPDSRFIITPHVAAKTRQSWQRMIDMAVNNAIHFFAE